MKITDACVFPYPAGDSSVRRLALEARTFGYDSIVVPDTAGVMISGVDVIPGAVLAGMHAKEIQSRVKACRGTGTVLAVQMGDNGFNRAVAGMPGVHILRGIGSAEKRAFDHVAAKIAAENGTAIDIDLSPVIFGRGHPRQKAIHRYRDLMVLHRRFEFPLTISSSARSVLGMRTVREVAGLCSLFGMDVTDVQDALAGVRQVTGSNGAAVRVIP